MANHDSTAIGRFNDSTPGGYFNGTVAEAAYWDLSSWPGATASDKADTFEAQALLSLAAGYSPLFFRLGLVAYWPLGGIYNDGNAANAANSDYDIVGGFHMDPQNTPSVADHPPMIYPPSALHMPFVAAAVSGNPWYYYVQQKAVA
jgi:hypothetical protein